MTGPDRLVVRIRLVAHDPPFRTEHGVSFGLADKAGAVDPVVAEGTTHFDTEIEVVDRDGTPDFRGPCVQGRPGDRFLYLSWGAPDPTEPFVMFARAKIKLADVPADLLDRAARSGEVLCCDLQTTDARGHPSSGTVKAPLVAWRLLDG